MTENVPKWAEIARRAQNLANQRGGDYADLTREELLGFMVEYDEELSKYEDATIKQVSLQDFGRYVRGD